MSHLKNILLARFPFASALRESMSEGYNLTRFKRDAAAGFIVSLIALPLSMALAIAIGLPPQHGLYTAIVAGFIVAILGGSRVQVTGPTAAFVVILAPIVAEHGLRGLIWCQILAGIFLLIFAAVKAGKLISFIPYTVITGFTAGIALILGVISLNDLLGLNVTMPQSNFPEQAMALLSGRIDPYEAIIGISTLLLLIYGGRLIRQIPPSILAIGAGIGLSLLFTHMGHNIDTISTRFSYLSPDGSTQSGIPPFPPSFHAPTTAAGSLFTIPNWSELSLYIYPALVIAVLAALESLLSATIADSMTRTRHHPTSELNGLGIGNIATALCAGVPATGALARTAAMVQNGGTSPLASAMHAVFLLLYMVLLSPLIGYMPMSALAAILVFTAYRMSHWRQCMHITQIAPRSEIVVLFSVFIMTVLVDMVAGIAVGMAMSAMLLMQRVTDMTRVERHTRADSPSEKQLIDNLPPSVMLYRITGPLFFSTTQRVIDQATYLNPGINCVIIDLGQVDFIDMSGYVAMSLLVDEIQRRHLHVIISSPATIAARIKLKLEVGTQGHEKVVYTTTIAQALKEAEHHLNKKP